MLGPYLLALLGLVFDTHFFPHVHIFTFAPFLALLIIRKQMLQAIRIALFAGLTYDLLSSQLHFGLYALLFAFLVVSMRKLKTLFFEEKPLALALFSALVALFFTLGEIFLLSFFGTPPPFSTKSFLQDLLLMPLLDGLFSFFWFSLPLKVYALVKRQKIWLRLHN